MSANLTHLAESISSLFISLFLLVHLYQPLLIHLTLFYEVYEHTAKVGEWPVVLRDFSG